MFSIVFFIILLFSSAKSTMAKVPASLEMGIRTRVSSSTATCTARGSSTGLTKPCTRASSTATRSLVSAATGGQMAQPMTARSRMGSDMAKASTSTNKKVLNTKENGLMA